MSETPVQYRERILSTLGPHQPLSVLEQTSSILRKWMDEKNVEQWKRVASSSDWSAAQILSHLAEGELVFAYRVRMIARSSGTDIQAFDQNAWVKHSGYLTGDPSLALNLFETVRKANLVYIRSLPASHYEHYGIHSERGKESVNDLIRLYAGHDLNHLKQIEQRFV